MKRGALSIILGIAIPFTYSVLSGLLSTIVENNTIRTLLNIPVGWPKFFYFYFIAQHGSKPFVENEIAFFVAIVVSNVFLYTFVAYFVLLMLSSKATTVEPGVLPDPPEFFEN